jgi:hypothetical protein
MARILCIALLVAATLAVAAENSGWVSESGIFRVDFRSELDPIVINRIHSWVLHVEGEDGAPVSGATISVTGGMPAHNHGLPTAPRVTREIAPGDYILDGLRFHMGGQWQLEITIDADGKQDVVVILLEL